MNGLGLFCLTEVELIVTAPTSNTSKGRRGSPTRPALPEQLRRAPNSTAVDHVVEQMRAAITAGALPPNSRLVEADLAERFGVSRGPVREALRRLESLGLVTLRPNRGAVVRTLSADDVLEVYVLRAALGVVAIRHLIGADLVTDDVATSLKKLEERARKESNRKRQSVTVECDLAFQSGIVDACGLPRVIAQFGESTAEVMLFITTSGIVYPDVDQIVTDHANLLEATLDRDAERAVELWRARMRTAVEEFLALIPNGKQLADCRPWLWQLL